MADVRQVAVQAVLTVKGIDISGADDETTLQSLDIESLDLVEIGMIVEVELSTEIDVDGFRQTSTLGGMYAELERQSCARPA
jgi:acyl carrier protein